MQVENCDDPVAYACSLLKVVLLSLDGEKQSYRRTQSLLICRSRAIIIPL